MSNGNRWYFKILLFAVILILIIPVRAGANVEYDLVDSWTGGDNPSRSWFYAHGAPDAPLLGPPSLLPGLSNDSGFGFQGGVTIRRLGPTDTHLTVGSAWHDLLIVGFEVPQTGVLTFSGTLFNVGASDIHYQVIIRTGARVVYPSTPGVFEYSLFRTSANNPISFSYTEATPMNKGQVAYLVPDRNQGKFLRINDLG